MPRIPNFADVYAPDGKLAGYLLALDHPDGGPKARFLASFGFLADNVNDLRLALFAHIAFFRSVSFAWNPFWQDL